MGWVLLCASNLLAILLWINSMIGKFEFNFVGVIAVLGLVTLLAHSLLICSVGYFQRPKEKEVGKKRAFLSSLMFQTVTLVLFIGTDVLVAMKGGSGQGGACLIIATCSTIAATMHLHMKASA